MGHKKFESKREQASKINALCMCHEISKKEQEQDRRLCGGRGVSRTSRLGRTCTSPEDIHPLERKAFKEMLASHGATNKLGNKVDAMGLWIGRLKNSSVLVYKRKKGTSYTL